MKRNLTLIAILTFLAYHLTGQVTLLSGSVDFLKREGSKLIKANYVYDGLKVRDLSETDYINKWVTRKNEKEQGMGDQWKEKWVKDRTYLYEPGFQKSFNSYIDNKFIEIINETDSAAYLLKVKTYYVDPGYAMSASNGTGSIASNIVVKDAGGSINCYLQFTSVSKPDSVILLLRVVNASHFGGCVDEGQRMAENYEVCGLIAAKFINKKLLKD
jgi:hypothetical protein